MCEKKHTKKTISERKAISKKKSFCGEKSSPKKILFHGKKIEMARKPGKI